MKQWKTKWIKTPLFGIIIVAVAVTALLTNLVETTGGPK